MTRTPRDQHAEDRFFLARVKRHEAAGARGPLRTMLARNTQTWKRIAITRALMRLADAEFAANAKAAE